MPATIRHVTIRGRVQGVGYRAWVEHTAMSLGLDGWVRNRRDGSVEAVLAGQVDIVEQMIAHCRRGPVSARVESVDASEAGADLLKLRVAGENFSMLPTI
ncbi:acylphosphatase [Tardiphaga sp.]|uniref:acylphosphatase n=1 Tax=Tardiphaga sp. TaxID=1926292 RepID=UPI00260E034D|nr:acylphosphatase [Tardiphaga sp.]MDB5618346.1 acylphosphatase [Tardiphaga sp.]